MAYVQNGGKGHVVTPMVMRLRTVRRANAFRFVGFGGQRRFCHVSSRVFRVQGFLSRAFGYSPAFCAKKHVFNGSPSVRLVSRRVFGFMVRVPVPPPIGVALRRANFVSGVLSTFQFFSPISLANGDFHV